MIVSISLPLDQRDVRSMTCFFCCCSLWNLHCLEQCLKKKQVNKIFELNNVPKLKHFYKALANKKSSTKEHFQMFKLCAQLKARYFIGKPYLTETFVQHISYGSLNSDSLE